MLKEFLNRQSKNFRVLLCGDAIRRFSEELTTQYHQVYTRELGASSVELGLVRSISALVRIILAVPSGMIMDKYSLKRSIIFGQAMSIFVPLIFALAIDWRIIIFAMIWQAAAQRFYMPSIWTATLASLNNNDRATGRGLNSTISSMAVMFASIMSAILVIHFGGINVDGIRPLFIIQLFVGISTFFIFFFLEDIKLRKEERTTNVFKDIFSIFKTIPYLKRALLMNVIRMSSQEMIMSFRNVYLVEVKGADATIIGLMGALSTIICLIFAIPIGRGVDYFGRKKTIFFMEPFVWIALITIVFAPSLEFLLLAAFFDGFGRISMEVVWSTFIFELIPLEARGRWVSLINISVGIGASIMPVIGGFLYDFRPEYIFFIRIIMDMSVLLIIKSLPDKAITTA